MNPGASGEREGEVGERHEIIVVGCGVAGLSTALLLQRAGHRVTIWAAATPPRTTSNVAAAFWYPYRVDPAARVRGWAEGSYQAFAALAAGDVGVLRRTAIDLQAPGVELDPGWAAGLPGFRLAGAGEVPPGYVGGVVFESFVIETPRYMPWLVERFVAGGGVIEERRLSSLDEATRAAAIVLHCAGLGAGELSPDRAIYPVRGQIVRVARPEGVDRVLVDETSAAGITYVVPRGDDVILGGTSEEGVWSTAEDPAMTAAILERCAALEPRLRGARVLSALVGLRPCRPEVRLAREAVGDAVVVHNYGHGGAGVTLSWGCAAEAAALALGGDPARWLARVPAPR